MEAKINTSRQTAKLKMTETEIIPVEKTSTSYLSSLAQIIAIALIALFALGLSASNGWRAAIGFTGNAITTKEDLTFLGFIHLIKIWFEYIHKLGSFFLQHLSDAILFYVISLSAFIVIILITGIRDQLVATLNDIIESAFNWVNKLIILTIGFPILMVYTYKSGHDSAVESLTTFNQKGCQANKYGWNWCHKLVENDKVIIEGFLVHQGKTQISIYQKDTKELVSFNMPPTAKLIRQHSHKQNINQPFPGVL